MTVDVLPAHPHLWAVAIQVACLVAVAVAAVYVWRRGHRDPPPAPPLAASDQWLTEARELAAEIASWSEPVETLR